MFKDFLKMTGLNSIKFRELVGGKSQTYVDRLNKEGPSDLDRYAMAAIASGLPMYEKSNTTLYRGVNQMIGLTEDIKNGN